MLLAHLLGAAGIETVVVEARSKEYVAARIRAGVIEHEAAQFLRDAGLGDRMDREGFVHDGILLSCANREFRIDFRGLAGRTVVIYGQTELQKDLFATHASGSGASELLDEADDVELQDIDSAAPSLTFRQHGQSFTVTADFIAGCDGAHGVSRTAMPLSRVRTFERTYPFGWLGVLARTAPVNDELIYCQHERGFALCSMRNEHLSRYYVQCPLDADLAAWTDDRFWDELRRRIPTFAAERLETGPSIEKSITPLRSFVAEPMRYGRLFLAGDAAHIVPPTGAKGLNLAISDVVYLSRAIIEHYEGHSDAGLDAYSDLALRRVWRAVRFSWWMTTMLHRFPDESGFGQRIQEAELDSLAASAAARTAMAESYTGSPY